MRRTYRTGLLFGGGVALIAVIALAVATALVLRTGLFADEPDRIALNGLDIDFALCPPTLVVRPGADLYRECREPVGGLGARISSGERDVHLSDLEEGLAVDGLPNGAIRLEVDGVAPGTVDILSCRSYAQDEEGRNNLMSLVPAIAYGSEPMTASIIAQPYIITSWPENRWRTIAADPTAAQLETQPSVYGTMFRCSWFLLPPGGIAARPGLVRSWTATDSLGEPAIHVLGPGGDGDASSTNLDGQETPVPGSFAFRSTLDGSVATTGDSWIDHYLLPAGSWVVTDRTTGRQATVDIAPGQTTRVVSVTSIVPLSVATPAP